MLARKATLSLRKRTIVRALANKELSTINYKDLFIEVTQKRVRSLRLGVKPDGRLVMTWPEGMPEADVMRFLDAHYGWMQRALQKTKERLESQQKLRYTTGEEHLLWGKKVPLRIETEQGRESVAFYADEIVLYVHPDRTPEQRRKLLYQGYYQQFKPVLEDMITRWEERLTAEMTLIERLANPKRYKGFEVSIRLMRTEWGSCTPGKRHMTFNVDLARMPKECMEYVVIHEFTHIDHCDHSPAFWALCDRRLADVGLDDSKKQRARMRSLTRCGGEF